MLPLLFKLGSISEIHGSIKVCFQSLCCSIDPLFKAQHFWRFWYGPKGLSLPPLPSAALQLANQQLHMMSYFHACCAGQWGDSNWATSRSHTCCWVTATPMWRCLDGERGWPWNMLAELQIQGMVLHQLSSLAHMWLFQHTLPAGRWCSSTSQPMNHHGSRTCLAECWQPTCIAWGCLFIFEIIVKKDVGRQPKKVFWVALNRFVKSNSVSYEAKVRNVYTQWRA